MYPSIRRMFARLTWVASSKSSGEPPQTPMFWQSTRTKSRRRRKRIEVRVGGSAAREAELLELGQDARIDWIEHEHRSHAVVVHERERTFEVRTRRDSPWMRWMRVDLRDEPRHRRCHEFRPAFGRTVRSLGDRPVVTVRRARTTACDRCLVARVK